VPAQRLLLMWDNLGLEYCANITEIDKRIMWDQLKGVESKHCLPNLNALILRARYNSQRHYEIYTVDVDPSITAEDMIKMFKSTPQEMADLIRSRGNQLYSDRADRRQVVIQ